MSQFISGSNIEKLFINVAKTHNMKYIRHATNHEDMYEHWDLLMERHGNRYKIDIKNERRIQRYDDPFHNMLVIEWKNVHGKNGWIYGMADYISYKLDTYFHIIPRKDLLNLANNLVDKNKIVNCFKDCVFKVYSRKNRNDLMSCIPVNCIDFHYLKWEIPIEKLDIWTWE